VSPALTKDNDLSSSYNVGYIVSLVSEQLSILDISKNYDRKNSNSETFAFATIDSSCMVEVLQVRVEGELF